MRSSCCVDVIQFGFSHFNHVRARWNIVIFMFLRIGNFNRKPKTKKIERKLTFWMTARKRRRRLKVLCMKLNGFKLVFVQFFLYSFVYSDAKSNSISSFQLKIENGNEEKGTFEQRIKYITKEVCFV